MESAPMIIMSASKVELLSLKEEKDIVLPRVICRYEEQVFIG